MKTFAPLLFILLLLAGCTGPKRVSTAEFKRRYARVGMAETLYGHTYLGQKDGRVYIQAGSLSFLTGKWSERIIYVDLAKLDPTFRDSLPKEKIIDPLWTPTAQPMTNPVVQPRSGSGN